MSQPIRLEQQSDQLRLLFGERKLTVNRGDILTMTADALVCPIDPELNFKSGLSKFVCQAAGHHIKRQRPLSPEPHGKVVVMPGGKLQAKYIFFTVILGEKNLDRLKISIRQAVERSIRYAEFLRLSTIAFPVLGSPMAAPPFDFVAREMLEDVTQYFQRRNTKIKAVLFSVYNQDAYSAFSKEAQNLAD